MIGKSSNIAPFSKSYQTYRQNVAIPFAQRCLHRGSQCENAAARAIRRSLPMMLCGLLSNLLWQGRNFCGGFGGCDTPPPKVRLAGPGLFLHGKTPPNWLRCDEQVGQSFLSCENNLFLPAKKH